MSFPILPGPIFILAPIRYCMASKLFTKLTALGQSEKYKKLRQTLETLSMIKKLIIDDFKLMNLDIEKKSIIV